MGVYDTLAEYALLRVSVQPILFDRELTPSISHYLLQMWSM